MKQKLSATGDVIDALGGTAATAKRMNVAIAVVSNWRSMELFPAHTYLALKEALREAGLDAPDELWRMHSPERAEAIRQGVG